MRRSIRALPGRLARSPGVGLALAAHLVLFVLVAAGFAALAMPEHGITPAAGAGTVDVTLSTGKVVRLPRDAPVSIGSRAGMLTTAARELVPDFMPAGGAATAGFFADRDRIAAIAAGDGAHVVLPGERGTVVHALRTRKRSLADLPRDFWLLAAQAIGIGMLGAWICLIAPRQTGAWMFGASCGGVLLAATSGAVFDARALTAGGNLLWTMQVLNLVGTNLCAAGLAAMFLYLPRRIAPRWAGAIALIVAAALGVAEGIGLIPLSWFYALLVVPNAATILALVLQWQVARGDPKARTVIRLIGASSFAGGALVCFGMVVPALFGVPPFASDGMTIFPLAVIYGGIGFGVAGVRLFALDAWSYRLVLGAATLLLLLVGDAVIVRFIDVERPVALALALLVVGYAYVPLRSWLWRRIAGDQPLSRDAMVRQTALVAFAADAAARRQGWRDLLDRVFAPLQIDGTDANGDVRLEASGEALVIPATPDHGGVRLRFARRGMRLFSPGDVGIATELVKLAQEAAKARAAYLRGVTEERRRIARDLHDDVSGLLLTGLHRTEVADVRGDVQQALGEIRTMMASLADGDRPLDEVLADLRFESSNRLSAAGIRLDWPFETEEGTGAMLNYARARALTSSLREIVTNTIKHAGASEFQVRMARDASRLTIVASDNGEGLHRRGERPATGRGIRNLTGRLDEIGAECRIEPTERGFRTRIIFPLG